MPSNTVVFFFDVDNTLLDNDRVIRDLRRHLEREVGQEHNDHYWEIFEQLRAELGYADYLGALQRRAAAARRQVRFSIRSRSLLKPLPGDVTHVARMRPLLGAPRASCRQFARLTATPRE